MTTRQRAFGFPVSSPRSRNTRSRSSRNETHDGRRKRILGIGGKKDGKPRLQGPPLYGYHLEDGIPVEDKAEGPVARFYLRRVLEGFTACEIAEELNKAGYRTRKGSIWRNTNVSRNLRYALDTLASIGTATASRRRSMHKRP